MRKKIDCMYSRLCALLLFIFISSAAFAQKTVTGKVTGAKDNAPLQSATVTVKGTSVATLTDASGNFSIILPAGKTTLIVSSIGYTNTQVDASSGTVSISLTESTSSLDEIVVTGYTSQRKKDITGAVAIVDIGEAKKIPATSSEQLLQGQAAGVTVINSGAPGAASTVFIRGISNFGHTQPLYVVDGVQVSDMSAVNPNDIASISVLKDAGSAAIYGISGGNGVVVVTTKKGRSGKATISYDSYFGTQRPLSGNVWNLTSPAQQSELAFRANDAGTEILYPGGAGTIPVYGYHGVAAGSFGTSGVTDDPAIEKYYHFDAAKPGNDFLVQKFATGKGTDWFHEVFKPAFEQMQTLTASGGNDKSSYLFSVSYLNQKGTLLNNYEKRYQARLNTSFNVKDHIRVGENGFITYRDNNGGYNGDQQQEGGSISFTYRELPIIPVYDIAGHFGGGYDGPAGEPLGNSYNPYALLANASTNHSHIVNIQGNIFAEADILKYFTLHTSIGGNLYNQYYYGLGYNQYQDYETHGGSNSANENDQISSNYNWTNTIVYKETFGKHNVQVLGGYELKASSGREFHASAINFFSLDPNFVQLQYGDASTTPPTSYIYQPTATKSYFARLDYSYNDKYILGATIRRDGFSIFYPGDTAVSNQQFGTFSSVSIGWRLSEENFIKNVSWINNLMLRASYGEAGNNGNITGNNAYTTYAQGFGSSYYGIAGNPNSVTQGFYQNQLGNTKVTWETDKITNIGLDATVFKNFDFTVEGYKKAISGLLFALQLPATTGGAAPPVVNVGDVQNIGLDISATYHAKIGRDFTFSIGANVGTYKSKITSIPAPGYFDFGYSRDNDIVRNEIGHPIGAFFGYQTMGIYQSDADAGKGATYSGAKAGSFIYKDVNGDGVIDANDRTFIGNPNPDFTYGVNITAGYKGFDFTLVLYGSQGNEDFNYVKYWTDFYSTFQGGKSLDLYNKGAIVKNGVVTNPGATLPAASFAQAFGSSIISSYYVENGSFLKCRVAQLGYTLEPKVLKTVGIDKLHFYIQATNLFTITKYSGLDPELVPSLNVNGSTDRQSAAFGIDYGAYPNNQKQYIVGVNLTF